MLFFAIGKNLPYILKLLARVPLDRNHRLGVELGIGHYKLNVIEVNHKGDCEQIRTEIVQRWLNGNGNDVSLSFLTKVANKLCKLCYNYSIVMFIF